MKMSKLCSAFISFMHNASINGLNAHQSALTAKKRSICGVETASLQSKDLDLAYLVVEKSDAQFRPFFQLIKLS